MSSNRAQRRAAKHKGKRPGETYADVLTKKKMIEEAVRESVHDTSIAIESDIKTQRFLWMAVIALNEAFGFGGERARKFLTALQEVAAEVEELAKKNGGYYARKKMMDRASQITGIDITPVHEEEMRQARLENESNGVFFPADDPDRMDLTDFTGITAGTIKFTAHYGYRKEKLPVFFNKEAFSVYCLACKHEVRVGAFVDENTAKKECEWLEKLNYGGTA